MPQPLTADTVARIAEMLAQDATNKAIQRALGVHHTTVARYRAKLGHGPAPLPTPANRSPLTLAEKWRTFARPTDDGHMEWTGRHRVDTGTMVLTHHGREYTARSVAFRIRTGRAPIGRVTAECNRPDCVAPQCVEDDPGRTLSRATYAEVIGLATPRAACNKGHDSAEHRRFNRDGTSYCATCHADRDARRQAAA